MTECTLTTAAGAPVADNQNSLTAGARGPVLLQDVHLLEKLAHFNRERIPERVVHAKGAGAHGILRVTHDITRYCKADLFSKIGQETPLFIRFSTVGGELGSADTVRDPRGFAVKFYTQQGNWDVVGNNTPVFFIRDPLKFPDFIHSQKRDPHTHLPSATAIWDYWNHSPESLHQITILFSDRGTPQGYRYMHGFSSHTFSFINTQNERFWVKFHFKSGQGIKNFSAAEAMAVAGSDPNYAIRDLHAAIAKKDFPRWHLRVQIMPEKDAANYHLNPFDLTKVWPHKDYPLIDVGVIELNRNPENYFAEVEQAAFSPGNVVPGIGFSPDKVLQARLFAYADAQRYRLGINHTQLPINKSHITACPYHRDGAMRFDGNGGGSVNYEPNSMGGPAQDPRFTEPALPLSGDAARFDHRHNNDDYKQAGDLFRLMKADEKSRLVENIVASLSLVSQAIQEKQIIHFAKADPEYGKKIAEALAR